MSKQRLYSAAFRHICDMQQRKQSRIFARSVFFVPVAPSELIECIVLYTNDEHFCEEVERHLQDYWTDTIPLYVCVTKPTKKKKVTK